MNVISAITEFAVVFAVVAAVLVIVGLRNGWFIDSESPAHKATSIKINRKPVSAKLAEAQAQANSDSRANSKEQPQPQPESGPQDDPLYGHGQPARLAWGASPQKPYQTAPATSNDDHAADHGGQWSLSDNVTPPSPHPQPHTLADAYRPDPHMSDVTPALTGAAPGGVHPAVAQAARKAGLADAEAAILGYWTLDRIQQRSGWLVFDPRDFLGHPDTTMSYPIPGNDTTGVIDMYPIDRVREVERNDRLLSRSRRKAIQARWDARRARRSARARSRVKTHQK